MEQQANCLHPMSASFPPLIQFPINMHYARQLITVVLVSFYPFGRLRWNSCLVTSPCWATISVVTCGVKSVDERSLVHSLSLKQNLAIYFEKFYLLTSSIRTFEFDVCYTRHPFNRKYWQQCSFYSDMGWVLMFLPIISLSY